MENYSKQIRNKTQIYVENAGEFLDLFGIDNSLKYELLIESLKCNDDQTTVELLKQYRIFSEQKQRETDFFKRTIYIQGYTDFYMMSRFHNKIEKNDSSFINIDYEKIERFFDDSDLYTVILKSMEEFTDLSAYNKIILFKSLTKEENEMLKTINPFFEFEKNKYDIEITKELIIKQMDKWNKSFGLENAVKQTSKFIFDLYNINSSNINNLFEQINIQGKKNPIEEDVIKYNDTYITEDILIEKLNEMYSQKQKIKK